MIFLSEILAKRLKAARESKGWTQAYLADLLGLTNGTISGFDNKKILPEGRTYHINRIKNTTFPKNNIFFCHFNFLICNSAAFLYSS
ncbi:MAG TPA: helix-turn-helix transcriptional regulator [Bacillota bacterium]|nr:helix-turn-helix transcriptional regulator [Bacillota bacterium]